MDGALCRVQTSSGDKEARPEFHPALVGLLLGSVMING